MHGRRYGAGTLLGYPYSWLAVGAILTTAVLGLIVSLSTFLVIGATSSVTFNVVRSHAGQQPQSVGCCCLARRWACA